MLINFQSLVQFQLHPSIRESRIAYVKYKQAMSGFLICLDSYAPGELLTSNGEPNEDALRKLVILWSSNMFLLT